MDNMRINLFALLKSVSGAQDLVSPLLSNHQQQVAYLSCRLAERLGLPVEEQRDVFLAGLVHDIGAVSKDQRLEFIENEPYYINNHAFIGAKLLQECGPLQKIGSLVKYHHLPWENGQGICCGEEKVNFGSHIIHVADRACSAINKDENILTQLPAIIKAIKGGSKNVFVPSIIEALEQLSEEEYIWFDILSRYPADRIDTSRFEMEELYIEDIIEVTLLFSYIIDFRSKFTSRHSAGVANTARELARLSGFSQTDCKYMLVAGYLHDLGKLAISNEILEKPGKLTMDEFNEIRSHTYYTYHLLDAIPEFEEIKGWAAYHHERLDGKGYPFHLKGDQLSKGARIMAVADVFTAITEDRPYREGMNDEMILRVLNNMVKENALDGEIVSLLADNFAAIKEIQEKARKEASEKYEAFLFL
ncbi:HD domain-containing phosphohydrolase [Konateibacter massiliensis]|uniref:HD domain-containing phosphohydrolase n=1 Tax=Konateibacter massiliensis TaxID=2002841 RepID=UPI000C15957C|nr:HD domain-containing phosphohydrolase [Konateibacter massiliensis]